METKNSFTPPSKGKSSQTVVREWEKVLLLVIAVFLSIVLFVLKGNIKADGPLNRLARNSLDLQSALTNGRPTLLEFYADWCEVCREMAFTIEEIKIQEQDTLNIVLLNVDNPQWQKELEKYNVTGIPHIELFDSSGLSMGKIIGAHTRSDIQRLIQALINKTTLPKLPGMGPVTALPQLTEEDE
ncbi:thioredoxin-like protein TxlA (chromatophore) [Paulinella micropora]|uniref:Thioredoxin-like protein TxlA n=1 Tax=Paulinella micropora TaxID=1928728 RepID=A0A1L5YC64_9EUKA|nr:thioredoxin-like protein TxlA [Paulinella micropora]AQX45066.1 thioredoxin-like protein TxlA [Paulinella micropora]BBL86277.1 thioredoxin-like protein TxlA [Paulinella micropora]